MAMIVECRVRLIEYKLVREMREGDKSRWVYMMSLTFEKCLRVAQVCHMTVH